MLELGDSAGVFHSEVAKQTDGIDVLLTVGKLAKLISDSAAREGFNGEIHHLESNEAAASYLMEHLHDGDMVLLKASRGMCFEKIADALESVAEKRNPKEAKNA